MEMQSQNLLLNYTGLFPFSKLNTVDIEPAIRYLLAENRRKIDELIAQSEQSWDTVAILEQLEDKLSRAWSPIGHLNAVKSNETLRKVYQTCLALLSDYYTELGQNKALYDFYQTLAKHPDYASFSQSQKQSLDNALRDFRLSGVGLSDVDKKTYQEINQRLSILKTEFENHLLDARQAWTKHILDKTELKGLPEFALNILKQLAKDKGLEGYLITLDFPSYSAILTYAENQALRYECFYAYKTCASDLGDKQFDNSSVMVEILKLKQEKAQLLGFKNYAELSLANKMADAPDKVIEFLTNLAEKAYPQAEIEFQQLKQFAKDSLGFEEIQPWDLAYIKEKMLKAKYDISQEELRPYFPLPKVLEGLFALVKKLFNLEIVKLDNIDVWHEDVGFYAIYDQQKNLYGQFYLDLYARHQKRGGAWMDEAINRVVYPNHIQTPVAYLVCNLTPPTENTPALLDHNEVLTLLHEFGHGLHHMLTQIDVASVAGIHGVEWDAVELPSQFMEYWAWERESLDLLSGHYQTGASIPEDIYQKLYASKNFMAAMFLTRQLEYGLFDFKLHIQSEISSSEEIQQVLDKVKAQVNPIVSAEFDRMQHSFSHIFAGGYAAGYYSYLWAEVLSADAFAYFKEQGLLSATLIGEKFLQEILQVGGSRSMTESFYAFRGREAKIEPLLEQLGLAA